MWKPRSLFSKPPTVTEPGLERPLRQRDEKPSLENDERDHRNGECETDGGGPGVPPDPAHVEAEVERGSQVEPEELGDQDHRRRGPDHHQHRAKLLTSDEWLV